MTAFRSLVSATALICGICMATSAPAAQRKAFPNLTTIYVVSGVLDDGGATNAGAATALHCSNVSGQNVTVRVLVLTSTGAVSKDVSHVLVNGASKTFSTHLNGPYNDDINLATGSLRQGVFNVEATNPAVFCAAMTVDAGAIVPIGPALHMVRVNALPGTQE